MMISGIGMISSLGLGMSRFEEALRNGWQRPSEVPAHARTGGMLPAYLVDLASLPDKSLLKKVRRSDKVSKMLVLAASDALTNSGIERNAQTRIGIIVATAFGPHVTTFSFLDDILDHGDAAVSPTTFSNSVHNAAASYVSMSLNIKGPTLTVTQFRFTFQAALQLAQIWLDQGRCDHVLAGAVDEYGEVLGYVADHKLTTARDGRITPFTFNPTCQVPGEGAAFLLLSRERTANTYSEIGPVRINSALDTNEPVDLAIIDADGMLPDESAYRTSLSADVPAAAYSPLFGSMMIGSAFNVAAGALMLKQQMTYATPIQDNPHGVRLLTETGKARLGAVRCIGYNCYAEQAEVSLKKI